MMTGPIREVAVLTSMAARATMMSPVSGFIRGTNRWTPAPNVPFFPAALPPVLEVSRVYFIEIGAPLRFVDLDVFGRRFHQMGVSSRGEHLAFHQKNDLIVMLHRRDFLCHGNERDAGIIPMNVLENGAFGVGIHSRGEIVKQQHFGI